MKRIKLTQGKYALVDDEDYEWINTFNWHASLESRGTKYYAVRWESRDGRRYKIRMHRFVLGLPPGLLDPERVVDHKNHNPLDNQKENLEIVTQEENMKRSQGWKRQAEAPCL